MPLCNSSWVPISTPRGRPTRKLMAVEAGDEMRLESVKQDPSTWLAHKGLAAAFYMSRECLWAEKAPWVDIQVKGGLTGRMGRPGRTRGKVVALQYDKSSYLPLMSSLPSAAASEASDSRPLHRARPRRGEGGGILVDNTRHDVSLSVIGKTCGASVMSIHIGAYGKCVTLAVQQKSIGLSDHLCPRHDLRACALPVQGP
jgi:hypothetical protein